MTFSSKPILRNVDCSVKCDNMPRSPMFSSECSVCETQTQCCVWGAAAGAWYMSACVWLTYLQPLNCPCNFPWIPPPPVFLSECSSVFLRGWVPLSQQTQFDQYVWESVICWYINMMLNKTLTVQKYSETQRQGCSALVFFYMWADKRTAHIRAVARGLGAPWKNIDVGPPHTHILYNIQAWNQIACFFLWFS